MCNKNGDNFQQVWIIYSILQFISILLLDEIIEIELRQVQNRFQSKRQPTLEAIKSKTTNIKIIINSSFCLLLLFD
ncbi:unnamed protein product [Rotaria sordida]|uniref:Mst1/2 SARAH domain-containing protein n=1 Tax=Rotaria sordida TaxID=392033 RepID=A0A820KRG6_9BILA|nr:unnamed protein product [Rotaria sordida]